MKSPPAPQLEQSSSIRSFRMSCDRCYTQKLKCSPSDGSETCQRCAKARCPCIFSRRAPTKRTAGGRPSRRCKPSPSPPAPPPVAAAPISPPSQPFGTVMATPKLSFTTSANGASTFEECTNSEIASNYSSSVEQIPTLDLHAFDSHASDSYENLAGYDWLHASLDMGDVTYYQTNQCNVDPFLQSAAFIAAAGQLQDTITPPSDSDYPSASTNSMISKNLPLLITDMQQQLAKLMEGHWDKDDTSSLGDYPIGRILELSQQFSAMAGTILYRAPSHNEESAGSDTDDASRCHGTAADTADAPTMLLVMCGYLWLVRIYGVVLNHFQKHLYRMSPSQSMRSKSASIDQNTNSTPGGSRGSALCLSELLSADDDLGLQRIHMAIRMLLDVLHEVESHLGPRGMVARDVTMNLLVNSGRCANDSSRGLEKKVATVKNLLLQKLGL